MSSQKCLWVKYLEPPRAMAFPTVLLLSPEKPFPFLLLWEQTASTRALHSITDTQASGSCGVKRTGEVDQVGTCALSKGCCSHRPLSRNTVPLVARPAHFKSQRTRSLCKIIQILRVYSCSFSSISSFFSKYQTKMHVGPQFACCL